MENRIVASFSEAASGDNGDSKSKCGCPPEMGNLVLNGEQKSQSNHQTVTSVQLASGHRPPGMIVSLSTFLFGISREYETGL